MNMGRPISDRPVCPGKPRRRLGQTALALAVLFMLLPVGAAVVTGEKACVLLLAYAERSGDPVRAGKLAELLIQQGVASDLALLQEVHRRFAAGDWKGTLPAVDELLTALGLPPYPVPPGLESGEVFVDLLCAVPTSGTVPESLLARVRELRSLFPACPALARVETQMLRLFVQRLKTGEIATAVPEAERLQRGVPGRPEFQTLIVRLKEIAATEEKKQELEQQGNNIVGKYRGLLREYEKRNSGTTFYDQRRTVRLTKTQQEELAREKAFLDENLSRGRELLAQAGALPPTDEQLGALRVELGLAPKPTPKKGIVR